MNRRERLWKNLEPGSEINSAGRLFNGLIFGVIVSTIVLVILETVRPIHERYHVFFDWFDVFSILLFTVEYVARLWACTADERYSHPVWGRLRYARTPMAIVDLLAIVPFFVAVLSMDLRVLRSLRLLRIIRVAKLGRYSSSARLIGGALRSSREELALTGGLMMLLAVIASVLLFHAEHEAQPDKFPDIPHTMWWAVVTLTTVGYGDIFPITPLGKLFAAVFAVLGIGMFALPTSILGTNFMMEVRKGKEPQYCPHCGKAI